MAQTATMERSTVADLVTASGKVPALAPVPRQNDEDQPRRYPAKMAKAIIAVTKEIGAIAKNGRNDFHKYDYVKWDDILNRLSELLPEHGLIITPSEISRSLVENDQAKNDQLVGITYEFYIVNEDGDEWPVRPRMTAFGRVRDSKNVCDDKAAAKCHTQAEKYFLIHFFKIRTADTVDSDGEGAQSTASAPKPPRPGSDEAKSLEGPRQIAVNGATNWTNAYIVAIESAATVEEMEEWANLNADKLDLLAEKYPNENMRVVEAVKLHAQKLNQAKVKAPKPPAPSKIVPMPDPKTDDEGFIAWLTEKLKGFDTYEAGETYWNETVEALDLPMLVQESAMAVWRQFERRFEP